MSRRRPPPKNVPGDVSVGDGEEEDDDGDEVAGAVPHHRVPVQEEHLLRRQRAHRDHQGDVKHRGAYDAAHADVVLREENNFE